MGYIAATAKHDPESYRQAVIAGSVIASFTVEGFGLDRLANLTNDEIIDRFFEFEDLTTFDTAIRLPLRDNPPIDNHQIGALMNYDITDINLANEGALKSEFADVQMPVLARHPKTIRRDKTPQRHPHRRLPPRNIRNLQPRQNPRRRRRRTRPLRIQPPLHTRRHRRITSSPKAYRRLRTKRRRLRNLLQPHLRLPLTPNLTSPSTTARTSSQCSTPSDANSSTQLIGGMEETTTGVIRLKALRRRGKTRLPHHRRQRLP